MNLESEQLGREATVMDVILDHRLLVTRVVERHPDRRHLPPVRPMYVFKCQEDIDAYWAQQGEREGNRGPTVSRNIEAQVSAERSTLPWPPNLDGDELWDAR